MKRQSSHSSQLASSTGRSVVSTGSSSSTTDVKVESSGGKEQGKKTKLAEISARAQSETSKQNRLARATQVGKPKAIIFHKEPKSRTMAKSNSKDFEF